MAGHGPKPRGMKPMVDNPMRVFKRIMGLVFKDYLVHFILVVICIVLAAFSSVKGTMFINTLISDFITPLVER